MMKYNLLIPIAGKGQRFVDDGYVMPKQLIMVNGTQMIDKSLMCIDTSECNLIFVVRHDHISNYSIDIILKDRYGDDVNIVVVDHITDGSVSTCLLAENHINNDIPLVIYTLDVYFEPKFKFPSKEELCNGMILTFKSNSPFYSYAKLNDKGYVIKTVEKEVISEHASVGIYCFDKGSTFIKYAKVMIEENIRTNGEFYIAPLYNLLINDGLKIKVREVDKMYVMGIPKELKFFEKIISNKFGLKPVALCCDHSGYKLKEFTKYLLEKLNIPYIDFGTYVYKDCDQVDYTKLACSSIQKGECSHGIGFCRTGQAVNMASNKHKDILGALVYDEYSAEYAIRHNGANFFCISTRVIDERMMNNILDIFIKNSFDGGRHQIRVQKILGIIE